MKGPINSDTIFLSIQKLFDSGTWWKYSGESVRELEKKFSQLHGCQYGIAVCNGTLALEVLLRAIGIEKGDQIVLPTYNFYSTPKTISKLGAKPFFVDVNKDNLTINVTQVKKALQSDIKAIIAVHISGSVAQMDELKILCEKTGTFLIEDCAQAAGACYEERKVGSWGDTAFFSFGGSKLLTCGQGGMITTSNKEIYEKCYAIVNRGMDPCGNMNSYNIIGENYQLSELAAVIISPQLELLEDLCIEREEIMRFLDDTIEGIFGLNTFKQFPGTIRRAQMRYSFFFDETCFHKLSRTIFIQQAKKKNIPLKEGYKATFDDPFLFGVYAEDNQYPIAKMAQEAVVSIHHTDLLIGVEYWKKAFHQIRQICKEYRK